MIVLTTANFHYALTIRKNIDELFIYFRMACVGTNEKRVNMILNFNHGSPARESHGADHLFPVSLPVLRHKSRLVNSNG